MNLLENFLVVAIFTIWTCIICILFAIVFLYKKVQSITMSVNNTNTNTNTNMHPVINDLFLPLSDYGLEQGELFPVLQFTEVSGKVINLTERNSRGLIIVFLSVNCKICESVYQGLKLFSERHPYYDLTIFMESPTPEEVIQKAKTLQIKHPIYHLTEADLTITRTRKFPFAYYISPEGIVMSKGVINDGLRDLDILLKIGAQVREAS